MDSNGGMSKFETLFGDLRLGVGAAFLLIRTNLDDKLDDLEEKLFNNLIDTLHLTMVAIVSSLLGKNLYKVFSVRR